MLPRIPPHTHAATSARTQPSVMARLEQPAGSALWQQQARLFADGPSSKEPSEGDAAAEAAAGEGDQGLDRSIDQLEEELKEREASLEAMQAQVRRGVPAGGSGAVGCLALPPRARSSRVP